MGEMKNAFLKAFASADVDAAHAALEENQDAMPWLEAAVEANGGHCYHEGHLEIANLVLSEAVRSFRDRVLDDDLPAISAMLDTEPGLITAKFAAGRGIAQAIHHWGEVSTGARLLDAGADVESETTLGETPLAMQLRFGSVDAVRFLLEHGAQPNRARAVMASDTLRERIGLLLAHGWDIAAGNSLLHDANHGHGKRVTVWLEFGVDPNLADDEGRTALHRFAERGTGRKAIRALVEAGADLEARDSEGRTPLDIATRAPSDAAATELRALSRTF